MKVVKVEGDVNGVATEQWLIGRLVEHIWKLVLPSYYTVGISRLATGSINSIASTLG